MTSYYIYVEAMEQQPGVPVEGLISILSLSPVEHMCIRGRNQISIPRFGSAPVWLLQDPQCFNKEIVDHCASLSIKTIFTNPEHNVTWTAQS